MQQNDAIVVDNDLLVVCDGTKETTDSNEEIHKIFTNDNDTLSITKNDSIDEMNMCYSPSWSLHGGSDGARVRNTAHNFDCDTKQLPTSLKFNRNTMSIFIKRAIDTNMCNATSTDFSEDSENLVCSPNINAIERETNQTISNTSNGSERRRLRFNARHMNDNFSKMYHSNANDDNELVKSKEKHSDHLMELLQYKDPMRNDVVLRSPRGNQPRAYTTDALYSALMDVKSGESIYR